MIEINLTGLSKLERGTHEGTVVVHRGGKVFRRKQKLGTKDKSKKGSNPRGYKNMPNEVSLRHDIVQSINALSNKSMSLEREISCSLDVNDQGQMTLGDQNVGEKDSCHVESGVYGMLHSHPGNVDQNIDTLSLLDIVVTIRHRLPIMVAQTCHNKQTWMAVSSDDTINVKDKRTKLNKWEALAYQADESTSSGRSSDKDYRNLVKQFCSEFKIKLYHGKNGDLKEYNGDW